MVRPVSIPPNRIFIVYSPTAHTAPDFTIKGLASTSGRLDVIVRAIISTFKLKEDMVRYNVRFYGVLDGPPKPPLTIEISPTLFLEENVEFREDEVALKIKMAMEGKAISGISILKVGLKRLIFELSKSNTLIYLRENGDEFNKVIKYIVGSEIKGELTFILGSHVDIPLEYEGYILRSCRFKVKVGPLSYLTSHVITLTNYVLDRYFALNRLTP